MWFAFLICYCLIFVLRQFLSTLASPTWKYVIFCAAMFWWNGEPKDLLAPFTTFPTSSHHVGLTGLCLRLCAHALFPATSAISTAVHYLDPSFHGLMQRSPSYSRKVSRIATIPEPSANQRTGGHCCKSPGEVGWGHELARSSDQSPHALYAVTGAK